MTEGVLQVNGDRVGYLKIVLEQIAIRIGNKIKSLPHAMHTSQIQVDLECSTQTLKLQETVEAYLSNYGEGRMS